MSSASSEGDDTGRCIVKLAEGVETGMLNATHISRRCKQEADDLDLYDAEHLRRAVAREVMKRDDTGEHANVVREIMAGVDVKTDPYAELDPCPGCARQWDQASYEYHATSYGRDDETWCKECADAHAAQLDDDGDDGADENRPPEAEIRAQVDRMMENSPFEPDNEEERAERRQTLRSYITGGDE